MSNFLRSNLRKCILITMKVLHIIDLYTRNISISNDVSSTLSSFTEQSKVFHVIMVICNDDTPF